MKRLINLNDPSAHRFPHFRHGCSSFPSRLVDLTHRPGRLLRIAFLEDDAAMIRELETAMRRRNRTARDARGAAMSQTGILPAVVTVRSSRVTPDALPILIAVPRIETVRRQRRVERAEPAHGTAWRPRTAGRRPRRRLRRHVRLSACALLGLTPFAMAAGAIWSSQPAQISVKPSASAVAQSDAPNRVCLSDPGRADGFIDGRRPAALDRGPVTLLSVEASNAASVPEAEEAVILPGYLLPDNTRGEPVHEGS